MSPETNPLRKKIKEGDEQLKEQLDDTYETSDTERQIEIVKDEIKYLEEILKSIKDFGQEDPEGIEELKEKTLADKKQLQEKLEKLQEQIEKHKEK